MTDEELLEVGIGKIASLGRWQLQTEVPGEDEDSFLMQACWREVKKQWADGTLARFDRKEIANSISWLAPDLQHHSAQRIEMARLTDADVPEQMAAQCRDGGLYAELLEALTDWQDADELIEPFAAIQPLVTHAAMSPTMRVRYMLPAARALAVVHDAGEASGLGWWERQSWHTAAIDGFIYELQLAHAGPSALDTPTERCGRYGSSRAERGGGEMVETETLIARARTNMVPLPIVLDADVLHRNVDYCLRTGYTPRVLEAASMSYTLVTGVVVFATSTVQGEVERQLVEIAQRREVALEDVTHLWEKLFLPRIRFVEISEKDINDPRVDEVAALHGADAPTAALAVMLAPCVVLTDNRKHFAPLGISDTRTDVIAVNANELARYYGSMNAMTLVPTVTGAMAVEGSKKVISTIGREAAVVIALLLIGAGVVLWLSEPGERMRESAKKLAREIGPPLAEAATRALVLTEEMSALAVDQPSSEWGVRFIAKILAMRQTMLSTAEISRRLLENGYRFEGAGSHATQTRRWLLSQRCFVEQQRGHWTLGYHAAAV